VVSIINSQCLRLKILNYFIRAIGSPKFVAEKNNLNIMKLLKASKIVILSLFLTLFSVNAQAQHSYFQKHMSTATELSQEFGIPSAVILAVAFMETGGGTSKNSKVLNNHFGIVGKNNVPGYKSRYKSFNSVTDSYRAFANLVSRKKYYSKLKGSEDLKAWVHAIASAGYSTQPAEWTRRVLLVINKYGLSNL